MLERKKGGRKNMKPTIEVFDNFYRDHTAEETAKHFGVKTPTVYRWATEFRKELKENGKKVE